MSTTNLAIAHIAASQNSKEVTANDAFDSLDAALCAVATFATANADVTLTQAQLASGILLKFTGALTADRHVNLPASVSRFIVVSNATTGGHNLIVQVTGAPGTTVTLAAADGLAGMITDGTNVVHAGTTGAAGATGSTGATGATGAAGSFDALDPTTSFWREEWNTSSTTPANTTPFGLYQWDAHNWVAGTHGCSIQQGGWDAQHERYLDNATDGSSGHGSRIFQRLQQKLNIGVAWSARIIFRLGATTSIRALAGFGHDDSSSPLSWFLGVRFDTTLGTPDTNFMFGAGASDGSSGLFSSSGVAADTAAHNLVISYSGSGNNVTFTMDGGSPVVVNIGGAIDGGVGLYAGLWAYAAAAAIKTLDNNFFAFKYTGLTR